MTDSVLLCEMIKRKGMTKVKLAEKIGLSRQGLHKKIVNITEFRQSEIEAISKTLDLTEEEERAIFFAS